MKILITGGAGFIGSHIADIFIKNNWEVIIIDNFSTGKKENLNNRVKIYEADICNKEEVEKIFMQEKPDIVSHHAAQIDVRVSLENPDVDANINIIGSLNVTEAARKSGVKKILFASSAGVYGDAKNIPTSENEAKSPPNPYAISKSSFEEYLKFYKSKYGMEYGIMRYSNVYGPRQNTHGEAGVICIFINNILQNKQSKIFGNGEQTRDFIFVKDVAKANFELAQTIDSSELVNVSTGKNISIVDLYNLIKDNCYSSLEAIHEDSLIGEILESKLDAQKFSNRWKFTVNIEDGLKETITFFKKQ